MTRQDKLIRRLLSEPKDFTWAELVRLLNSLGYQLDRKGKTSGSRVAFWRQGYPPINLHRPHPGNVLKPYQIQQMAEMLRNLGLLTEEEQ